MKTAVIYASRYGYTRQYAEWLADDLGADLFDVRAVRAGLIEQYDILVLGGGVYAGKLNGIEWFAGNAERLRGKKLIYFAVGLRNPDMPETEEAVRQSLHRQLPENLCGQVRLFCLHGGLDDKKLSFVHRAMMRVMKASLRRKPVNERSAEDNDILTGRADYLDRGALAAIAAFCRE